MTVADEIDRASKLARDIIAEYVAWSDKVTYGDELHDLYREVFDFVNFRVETADSCLLLLDNRRVGDALGLRSPAIGKRRVSDVRFCPGLSVRNYQNNGRIVACQRRLQPSWRACQSPATSACTSTMAGA
jgi:hypothetical protein